MVVDSGINLHYINQLYVHNESASSPDMCAAVRYTQKLHKRVSHVHSTQLELNWQSLVSRQHIRLNLHTVVIIDFDLILGIYFTQTRGIHKCEKR